MTTESTDTPLLDAAQAEFLQDRVAINVAARDAHNVPTLTRALGCRVSPDRRRVTVFVSPARAEKLLAGVRDNGAIAAVFTRPSTHETLQLKGRDASVVPLEAGDRESMATHRESFVGELQKIGYTDTFAHGVIAVLNDDAVGVAFTPSAAFVATPGPAAGQRLKG
jgi:hypothetical protein